MLGQGDSVGRKCLCVNRLYISQLSLRWRLVLLGLICYAVCCREIASMAVGYHWNAELVAQNLDLLLDEPA